MKRLSSFILIASLATSGIALAQDNQESNQDSNLNLSLFTGDVRLACEAILCLSSGTRPSECMPSLSKFFSLRKQHKKDKSTTQKRSEFLNLCPTASYDASMRSLVHAIVHGAGQCDARTLNATLIRSTHYDKESIKTIISNQLPQHCVRYIGHAYTDINTPKYIGTPERGGFWSEPAEYEAKKAEYDKRIAEEDRAEAERKGGIFGRSSYNNSSAWKRWSQ